VARGGLLPLLLAALLLAACGGDADEESGSRDRGDTDEAEETEAMLPPRRTEDLDMAVEQAGCELRSFAPEGNEHVDGRVGYRSNPPHSGDHNPIPADDGAYGEAPTTEMLVHSLEHGRVIVQFDPDAPDALEDTLEQLYEEDPYHLILTPNATDMPFEVAATAWTKVLGCPDAGEATYDAIRAFSQEFRDTAPERVP